MAQTRNSSEIRSNKLFAGIHALNFNFKEKNFFEVKEGDVIYSRGEKSEYMYLLLNGRIKLKTYENPRQPKVFLVSKNEFFGEKELLDKTIRHSSAIAERESSLFKISFKDFHDLSSNRKILSNLTEKKYEEVTVPSRKTELKDDIFKRKINDAEPVTRKKNGIELLDYSYENPLLELKAKDEISEALKMYEDKGSGESEIINFDEVELLPEEDDTPEEVDTENKQQTETTFEETPLAEELEENNVFFDPEEEEEQLSFDSPVEIPVTENIELTELIEKEILTAAVDKINSGLNFEGTDRLIVETCSELVSAERGILFYPADNNLLEGKLSEEEAVVTASPDSIAGRCYRNLNIINIKDVFNDPAFNPSVDYISYFHINNILCIPFQHAGKVKAVLQLFNSMNEEFSETDEKILSGITPVILNAIEKWEPYRNNGTPVERIADITVKKKKTTVITDDKQISLRTLMEFLLQEFQVVISDVRQFNTYLQRSEITGETKEISDIVTSQTTKILDLLEALKAYSEAGRNLSTESQSYISVFDNMITLLAEYTEGRKVNLYKRFEADANISVNSRFLYLSISQLIKYQCDLMPFGGNIFISSNIGEKLVEVNIRNATKKTDESLVISPVIDYNESTPQGIGLSLARRIIEDHNASLNIKNQSGTGLEIIISFPLSK
jgi:hypothetical protein